MPKGPHSTAHGGESDRLQSVVQGIQISNKCVVENRRGTNITNPYPTCSKQATNWGAQSLHYGCVK